MVCQPPLFFPCATGFLLAFFLMSTQSTHAFLFMGKFGLQTASPDNCKNHLPSTVGCSLHNHTCAWFHTHKSSYLSLFLSTSLCLIWHFQTKPFMHIPMLHVGLRTKTTHKVPSIKNGSSLAHTKLTQWYIQISDLFVHTSFLPEKRG